MVKELSALHAKSPSLVLDAVYVNGTPAKDGCDPITHISAYFWAGCFVCISGVDLAQHRLERQGSCWENQPFLFRSLSDVRSTLLKSERERALALFYRILISLYSRNEFVELFRKQQPYNIGWGLKRRSPPRTGHRLTNRIRICQNVCILLLPIAALWNIRLRHAKQPTNVCECVGSSRRPIWSSWSRQRRPYQFWTLSAVQWHEIHLFMHSKPVSLYSENS